MTRRRWIADRWNENSAAIVGEQAVHLARVLRGAVGQEFDIVAGDRVCRGVIESIHESTVEFSLHEAVDAAGALPLVVALAIVRFERMEWAIEKLTELGVARIIPVIAQRSEKHLTQAAMKRAARWRKIALESAQQSRRSDVPEISDPLSLSSLSIDVEDEHHATKILLSERERGQRLRGVLESPQNATALRYQLAIGPEGGWTEVELRWFAEHGWQSASLGPRILRAETAAIAAASIVSAWAGC